MHYGEDLRDGQNNSFLHNRYRLKTDDHRFLFPWELDEQIARELRAIGIDPETGKMKGE